MEASERQALTDYLDALATGDLAACAQQLATDVRIMEGASLPFGGEWVGRDGFTRLIERIGTDFEPEVLESQVDHADSLSILQMRARFTSRASGRTEEVDIVELYSFGEDGLISRVDVYYRDPTVISRLLV
jgi:hypothetical protein